MLAGFFIGMRLCEMTTKKRAERCITHHWACDCREYRAQEMEEALKIIRTWAQFDYEGKCPNEKVLVPEHVIKLCDRVLNY